VTAVQPKEGMDAADDLVLPARVSEVVARV
jgi:hypothetical protein